MLGKKTKEERKNLNNINEASYNKYKDEAAKKIKLFNETKDKYNNLVTTINSERLRMRDELKKLYDFLKIVGKNFNKQITPFNFVDEEPAPSSELIMIDPLPEPESVEEHYFTDPILRTAHNNKKNKNINEEYSKKISDRENIYVEDLNKRDNEITFLKDACDIAEIYRINVCILADVIKQSIIPELEFINAFLYADVIRERILDGEKVNGNIEPFCILEYQNTPQDIHFQFVKNTFDFYEICTTIYTESILTNIIQDRVITDEEKEEFNRKIKESKDIKNKVLEKKVI